MWFNGVEVEQETSAPPPKKNPVSAPDTAIKTGAPNENIVQNHLFNIALLSVVG